MKLRVRVARGDEADAGLMRLAGVSAGGHAAVLLAAMLLPRFGAASPLPRATVAEIVPASALFPQGVPQGAPQAPPSAQRPSERAEAAREAQRPKPAPPPRRKAPAPDPSIPPLEKRSKAKAAAPKPAEPARPEPAAEPAGATEDEPPAAPAPEEAREEDGGGISFGGGGAAGGVPSIGSSAFPFDYYRASLVSILQSNWRRPVDPDATGTRTARVQFTIMKSGIIKDPRLAQRSGHDGLDQSALRAVYDSNPLPPLPFQYGHESVTAEVVFELTPE
ncbi:MAG TPA: energy transducer TonB [Candidatus Polarisedimenticolia bacterium]|nr:energy transducer TonB [Candidatus Polarisedimenticolia bacterium]